MKVPLSWLKEFIELTLTPQELSHTLTLAGLEVEGIYPTPIHFSGVVVGKVLHVEKHPLAERLSIATVSDGTEHVQVVCGAPNCRSGITTAFAKIGAVLTGSDGKSFKIKKSKLREVDSFGMLCSGSELKLNHDQEGILELSDTLTAGTPLEVLYGDLIIDISLTPNLGHCMSILGIARELSTLLNIPLKRTPDLFNRQPTAKEDSDPAPISIRLIDKKQALAFGYQIVKQVHVQPSPEWLQKRLESCGIRPINNVVDVGNFVMLEIGQPLHVFDYDKIEGQQLIISSDTSHKTLKTLDGILRDIPPEAILVCDGKKALSFGGVMGGTSSAIESSTRNILIEAAYFTPQAIRKSTKLLNLRSESSQRFEKGVDPQAISLALDRAASLLTHIAGGTISHGIVQEQAHPFTPKKICCRIARVNGLLGTQLSLGEMTSILTRSCCAIVKEETHSLLVAPPTYRHDLLTEVDIIEEIARIYGYHCIPKKTPYYTSSTLLSTPMYLIEKKIRSRLIGQGLQEFITCDLISPSLSEIGLENTLTKDACISVLHPNSIDQSVLRTSLLPGLLQVVKYNRDHDHSTLSGFEIGKIHLKEGELFKEYSTMAVVLTGQASPYHFDPKPQEVDFFTLKGIIDLVLTGLGITGIEYIPSHLHSLHPGKQASVRTGETILGTLGEVHPHTLKKLELGQPVYFAEINIPDLLARLPKHTAVTELSPYPGSERDWTLTVDNAIAVGDILKEIRQCASRLLQDVYLLDIYKSDQIGKDKKNITFRFVYRDLNKTIAFETVEKEHTRIIQKVHHAH